MESIEISNQANAADAKNRAAYFGEPRSNRPG